MANWSLKLTIDNILNEADIGGVPFEIKYLTDLTTEHKDVYIAEKQQIIAFVNLHPYEHMDNVLIRAIIAGIKVQYTQN